MGHFAVVGFVLDISECCYDGKSYYCLSILALLLHFHSGQIIAFCLQIIKGKPRTLCPSPYPLSSLDLVIQYDKSVSYVCQLKHSPTTILFISLKLVIKLSVEQFEC